MRTAKFSAGDWVIYRKTKFSSHPSPRARNVAPSKSGEGYVYNVDKFWIVVEVSEDGVLYAMTRRGKLQQIVPSDPNLHRATWWERLRHRSRFAPIADVMNLMGKARLTAGSVQSTQSLSRPSDF